MNKLFTLKTTLNATLAILLLASCGCELLQFTDHNAARKQMDYAQYYLERGLPDSAFAAFGLALEENPKITDAHMGMGNIYRGWKNYSLASRSYQRAVKLEPNNFNANYSLGEMYHILGKLQQAMSVFLHALTIDPSHFGANDQLAQVYLRLQRPGDAQLYAQRAVKLNPDSQLAWAKLGLAYSRTDQHEKAVDAFRKAAELGPVNDNILLGLAISHIKLNNYQRAINTLNQLINRAPSAIAYERMGYAHFKLHHYTDAQKYFNTALQINDNDIAALNGSGVCHMTNYILGKRTNSDLHKNAYQAWHKSIKLDPNQPHILDLMARYKLK